MTLKHFFQGIPKAAVAFSGGADSAFLLWAAKHYHCNVHAYLVKAGFQPDFELNDAKKIAETLSVPMTIITTDILSVPEVVENGPRRCYYCKKTIFTLLSETAKRDGYSIIFDGTNASDDVNDRPGIQALKELQIRSPLRECGITKSEVRMLSKQIGLFTWQKPAYACLATRIPTGSPITYNHLNKIETAEHLLSTMGFFDFRIRLTETGNAKIQVTEGQLPLVIEKREEILCSLNPLFPSILLDLVPRLKSE